MKSLIAFVLLCFAMTASASPGQPYFVRQQSPVIPFVIPGTYYWWVATDATNNLVGTNTLVTNWVDRVHGLSLLQANAGCQPTLISNYLDFQGVFGSGQTLSNGLDISTLPTNFTFSWIVSRTAYNVPTKRDPIVYAGTAEGFQYTVISGNDVINDVVSAEIVASKIADFTNGVIHDVVVTYDESTRNIVGWTNGVQADTFHFTSQLNLGRQFVVGGIWGGPNYFFKGRVYEVSVYTNQLSQSNILAYHQYRTNIYGGGP